VIAYELRQGDKVLGRLGQLSPTLAKELDLRSAVFIAELDEALLLKTVPRSERVKPLPKFPSTTRDAALLVPLDITHAQIESRILGAKESLLESVRLFDLFVDPTGQRVPNGLKSMAYSFTYRSADRTLTADEVTRAHDGLKKAIGIIPGIQFRE